MFNITNWRMRYNKYYLMSPSPLLAVAGVLKGGKRFRGPGPIDHGCFWGLSNRSCSVGVGYSPGANPTAATSRVGILP